MERKRIRIRRGLEVPLRGAPAAEISEGNPVTAVAVLGPDFDGLKPSMSVAEGERVRLGQALFTDRRNPRISYTAPGAGVVRSIVRGPRRALHAVIIDLEGSGAIEFPPVAPGRLANLAAEEVVERLLASGSWIALRSRPYARVPDPDAGPPAAILVTAMDSNPLAGDLTPLLEDYADDLAHGVTALSRLTEGPVYLCCAPGAPLPEFPAGDVRLAEFDGPHPAGLPGTHMHFLCPPSAKRAVWHLHLQDTIAIGKLFVEGRIWTDRRVPLCGPRVARPRWLHTRLGASLSDLVRGELEPGPCRVVSGSVLDGHHAHRWAAYLGRYERQVTALPEGERRRFLGWLMPGMDRYSALPAFGGNLRRGHRFDLSTSRNGSARAMVPIGNFESVMPLDLLPAPLLKALIVGDTDSAQALGCLELDQEDLALCTFVCPSKYDYGAYLRRSLNQIEKEG